MMKTNILILLLFPIICFSQNENNTIPVPSKQFTNDCPFWNSDSKTNNKTEYYKPAKPIKNPAISNNDYPGNNFNSSTKKAEEFYLISSKKNYPDISTIEETKIKKDTTDVVENYKENEKIKKKLKRLPSRNGIKFVKRYRNKCPQF